MPPGGGPLGPLAGAAGLEMAGRAMAEQHARALQAVREAEENKAKAAAAAAVAAGLEREDHRRRSSGAAGDKEVDRDTVDRRLGGLGKAGGHGGSVRRGSGDLSDEAERHHEIEEDDLSPPPMKRERHHSSQTAAGSAGNPPGNAGSHEGKQNGQPPPTPIAGGANIRIANRGEQKIFQ